MLGALGGAMGLGGQSFINGQPVTAQQNMILAGVGLPLMPGARYWYDKMTGAYGFEGGPCTGQGIPNMPGFAVLQPNASNGTTGVFVNGRQLHFQDVMRLQRLGIPCVPGRYWMNASGQFGYETSPMPLGQVNWRMAMHPAHGHTAHTSVIGGNVYSSSFGGGDSYYFVRQQQWELLVAWQVNTLMLLA